MPLPRPLWPCSAVWAPTACVLQVSYVLDTEDSFRRIKRRTLRPLEFRQRRVAKFRAWQNRVQAEQPEPEVALSAVSSAAEGPV